MCQLPSRDALAPLRRMVERCEPAEVRFEIECHRVGPEALVLRCFAVNETPEPAIVDAIFLVAELTSHDTDGGEVSLWPERRSLHARMKPASLWVGVGPGERGALEDLAVREYGGRAKRRAHRLAAKLLIRSPGRKPYGVELAVEVLPPAA
jgi:hypothetical protein